MPREWSTRGRAGQLRGARATPAFMRTTRLQSWRVSSIWGKQLTKLQAPREAAPASMLARLALRSAARASVRPVAAAPARMYHDHVMDHYEVRREGGRVPERARAARPRGEAVGPWAGGRSPPSVSPALGCVPWFSSVCGAVVAPVSGLQCLCEQFVLTMPGAEPSECGEARLRRQRRGDCHRGRARVRRRDEAPGSH